MPLLQLAERPRLFVVVGFASDAEVEWLLGRGKDPGTWEKLQTQHDHTGFSFEWPVAGDETLERLALRMQRTFKMGDELPRAGGTKACE